MSSGQFGVAAGGQWDMTMNFPLKAIKRTIFELNKDLVFPDILVLRILFGPANRAAYLGTDDQIPTNAVGPLVDTTALVAPAPLITAYMAIYNLVLFLAVEKNEDLAQSVRALVNSPSGMNILIPYPWTFMQNLSGTSQNISLRFNRGHGKNLLQVVSSPFNVASTNNTVYDCFNITNPATVLTQNTPGAKVTSYYSQLDNIRLQDIEVTCGLFKADDYRENRKFMKDSPYLNVDVYNQSWFHMDQFYEDNPGEENNENLDKGMSLIVERKYDLLLTCPTAGGAAQSFNWYTHAIVQKDLHIGSNMIAFQ